MRKSMMAMLAVGCLTWVAPDVVAQGKKGGGGGATPMLEAAANNEFQKLDKNGDGKLNLDEMPESLRKELSRFDRNGDGLIDRNEFQEYFLNFAGRGQPGGAGGPGAVGGKKGPMGPSGAPPGAEQPGGFGGGGFGGQPGGFGGGAGGFGGNPFGPMAQASPKPMTWEYRVLSRGALTDMGQESLEAGLNKVGSEGWELVTVETGAKAGANHTFIFRRPGAAKPRADANPLAPATTFEQAAAKIEFRVYKMKHANAVEVGQTLSELMRSGKPDSLRIVADPNTNQLLLKGTNQVHADVQMLLECVDVPSEVAAPPPGPGKKGGASKK